MRPPIWIPSFVISMMLAACTSTPAPLAPTRLEIPRITPLSAETSRDVRQILIEIRESREQICLGPTQQRSLSEWTIALTKDRRKLHDLWKRSYSDGR